MPVNIVQWHVEIGASDAISNFRYPTSNIASSRSMATSNKKNVFIDVYVCYEI